MQMCVPVRVCPRRGCGFACDVALLCRAAVLLALGSVLAPELMSSMGSRLMRGSEACRASSSSALIRVRSCMLKLRSLSDSTPCPWAQQQIKRHIQHCMFALSFKHPGLLYDFMLHTCADAHRTEYDPPKKLFWSVICFIYGENICIVIKYDWTQWRHMVRVSRAHRKQWAYRNAHQMLPQGS